jgi:hypothetical protein
MKKLVVLLFLASLVALLTLSCSSTAYVKQAPPPVKAEVKPAAPSVTAIWIDGHWQWNGNRYVWKKGHWEKKAKGAWVKGQWKKTGRGHKWVPGHWKK